MNPALPKKIGLYSIERKSGAKKWIFLFIIVIFAVFEVTILDYFKIFNIKPDLFLIAVLMASLSFAFQSRLAILLSAYSGMLKDILGINPFGINTLLFPLWSFLIIKLSRKITLDNNFISSGAMFVIVILNAAAIKIIFLFSGRFMPWGVFLRTAFLESLYTALVLPLLFRVIWAKIK